MRPKEGTKIELQRDLSDFVRFVRFSGLHLSDLSDLPISAIKKRETDGRTDRPTDRPSYRDAWTHLKIEYHTHMHNVIRTSFPPRIHDQTYQEVVHICH